GLASGESLLVTFRVWAKPHLPGGYSARCSTYLDNDQNRANDVAADTFVITARSRPDPGWRERASMPLPSSNRAVKDGGWLTYDHGTGRIYAAKGNKTSDFYAYSLTGDSWRELAPIPDGTEGKKPGKGAAGCADGSGVVYATKGNNTDGFYRYVAAKDSWYRLAPVPLGLSGKKVKGGTDLVFVPSVLDHLTSGQVYLLKGFKNEFYCYDVARDSWRPLPSAPAAKYDRGSWLVLGDEPRPLLYAHQAKYHGFHAYDPISQTWSGALTGMPYIGMMGRPKKSKDGGCAAWLAGSIYALKGGNTQEFWRYFPAGDSWHEYETIPQFGSSLKKKKVKAGGDLTADADFAYALKGNKTLEFWQYVPQTLDALCLTPHAGGVVTSVTGDVSRVVRLSPNLLRAGFATVRLSGQAAQWSSGPVQVSVLDVSGRLVHHLSFITHRSAVLLDLRGLSAGVYTVRLTAGGRTATQRLVICH
ncbi:MAG: T9SS type A sorting domain-containing protein, partial [candidate division WOR-3 bacterium]